MKRLLIYLPKLLLAGLLISSAANTSAQTRTGGRAAQHANMPAAAVTDTGFVRKNVMDNMMEIRLSEIGRDQASNKQVTALAEQIITDHTQILNDLTAIATKMNVPAPDTTTMEMPTGGGDVSGGAFDKTWLNQMLVMHQAKVQELQMAIPQLKDLMLKTAASSALPKIKLHTDMLAKLAAATK